MRLGGYIPHLWRRGDQWQKIGMVGFILAMSWVLLGAGEARAQGVEVRRLGLSRIGENTELTVILSRSAIPRVASQAGGGRSQLVVDFPQARAAQLPPRLGGDDVLVQHVRTEASGTGVKIILEMFPQRPYLFSYSKTPQPLGSGGAVFRLNLRSDPEAAPAAAPPAPSPPEVREPLMERPSEPAPTTPGLSGDTRVAPSGTFEELYQLVPQARSLLDYLRKDGWTISEAKSYDRPGLRFSRSFTLTNRQYPEIVVRLAHLPPNAPGAPTINILDLSMDQLRGAAVDKYREYRNWNFAKIKTKFEDIGDFFDDAQKPLRVEIRKQCQDLAVRYAHLLTNFLNRVAPPNSQVANQVMTHVRQKVSPRFEGVQYTLSENPLLILNLVDFLNIRVYFIDSK